MRRAQGSKIAARGHKRYTGQPGALVREVTVGRLRVDPVKRRQEDYMVLRGSSWWNQIRDTRYGFKGRLPKEYGNQGVGVRIAVRRKS